MGERLWALTEMFPESLRNSTKKIVNTTGKVILGKILVCIHHKISPTNSKQFTETYLFACTSTWYVSTTAALLLMPVLFETERIQMEEAQKNHSKQVSVLITYLLLNKYIFKFDNTFLFCFSFFLVLVVLETWVVELLCCPINIFSSYVIFLTYLP